MMLKNYAQSVRNWRYISDDANRILIIGRSRLGKTNV